MQFYDFESVAELCLNRAPEGLQLEFKEKSNPGRAELDNADKKVIAKAVSAFANSGGGTLIIGVRTAKVGEVDVAAELKAIVDPELCRTQVEYVCKTNISPEISGLNVRALVGPSGDGIIICEVPPSERRPHMSTAPSVHTYYRRTFQGDVPMTPFEVQEQILAVREAFIEPTAKISRGATVSSMSHWIAIAYGIDFAIENNVSRTCLNPFLRVRSSVRARSHTATYDPRLGMWKNSVPVGTIVHVDDALRFFNLQFIARVFPSELIAAASGGQNDLLGAIHLYGGNDELHSPTVTDKTEINELEFEVNYGAENSVSRTAKLIFDRREISAKILLSVGDSIRERTIGDVGVWRSDLIAELRDQYSTG